MLSLQQYECKGLLQRISRVESSSHLLLVLTLEAHGLVLEKDVLLDEFRLEPGLPLLGGLDFLKLAIERLLQGVGAGQFLPQRSALGVAGGEPVGYILHY